MVTSGANRKSPARSRGKARARACPCTRSSKVAGAPGMRYERHVSAGIIVFHRGSEGCEFLLLLSRLTKRPLWEFPKGGVDEGETPRTAAFRELEEETALGSGVVRPVEGFERVEQYRFTTGKTDARTLVHKRVTYYLAEAAHQNVKVS